ncbi:MAG: F0F1 ATP synthase subunit gamma [Patescibacteria group bacterium]|nr:F0F1 ATP synthase subunit gamma [Patescibacteria group bacterium]
MQNVNGLSEEIELMRIFRMITQAYEEISVMRMQKIRTSVINTRNFLDQLSDVYTDIKGNYRESIMTILTGKKKDVQKVLNINKNGRTVAVLISTNAKLSGEIVGLTFKHFANYVQQHPEVDIIIVGRQGKQMFESLRLGREYKFFEFDEKNISVESLKEIILAMYPYEEVEAFFGKFESLVFQSPVQENLSGDDSTKKSEKENKVTPYMFEPSIEKILQFFETQIFSSLVKQTFNESELARYASRIRAMEEATNHIDKTKTTLERNKRKIRQLLLNKKQLETASKAILLIKSGNARHSQRIAFDIANRSRQLLFKRR